MKRTVNRILTALTTVLLSYLLVWKQHPHTSTLSKTNPLPLKDVIENFAEVKATLHNTPYEWISDS